MSTVGSCLVYSAKSRGPEDVEERNEMNTKRVVVVSVLILILVFMTRFILAQESNKNVDWDKIESKLFQDLKSKRGISEARIHEEIGRSLLGSDNQWERATMHFKKAVQLDPNLYASWLYLGLIYPETAEYFEKAIQTRPDSPEPYYWLGYNYCRYGRDKEALPVFEKYLEVAQGHYVEKDRIRIAKKIVKEVRSGKVGENIKMIRVSE